MEHQQMNMLDGIENLQNEDSIVEIADGQKQKSDIDVELGGLAVSLEDQQTEKLNAEIDNLADKLGSYEMARRIIVSKAKEGRSNAEEYVEKWSSHNTISTPERQKTINSLQYKLNAVCYLENSSTFDPKDPFHDKVIRRQRPDDYEQAAYCELEKLFFSEMDSYQRYMYESHHDSPEERFKLNHLKVGFVIKYFSPRENDHSEEYRQNLKEEATENNIVFQNEVEKSNQ